MESSLGQCQTCNDQMRQNCFFMTQKAARVWVKFSNDKINYPCTRLQLFIEFCLFNNHLTRINWNMKYHQILEIQSYTFISELFSFKKFQIRY